MIRIAAVGDLHYDENSRGRHRKAFERLEREADLLLIAGDLTQKGTWNEASALLDDLVDLPLPVICVLGNHDFHSSNEMEIREKFIQKGVHVLEGESCTFTIRGKSIGIGGIKGFGGGFSGASASDFGEIEMRAFARHGKRQAELLYQCLSNLKTQYRFALTHFSPAEGTLYGEKRELYPFLGSDLLGEAIDRAGCMLAFHGHAHRGVEVGCTPGGTPVRNVAEVVLRQPYQIYEFK
jgi:Icc-related predicted phosphoesterase